MIKQTPPPFLLKGSCLPGGSKLHKGDLSVLIAVITRHEILSDRPLALPLSLHAGLWARFGTRFTCATPLITPLRHLGDREDHRSQQEHEGFADCYHDDIMIRIGRLGDAI